MPRSAAVDRGIEKLFEIGVLKEDVLAELGEMLQRLESISNGFGAGPKRRRKRGRPQRGQARAKVTKKEKRTRVQVTKEQLQAMLAKGMTGSAIAKELGISEPTLYNRKKAFGLAKTRGGAGGNKVAKKTTRKVRKKVKK